MFSNGNRLLQLSPIRIMSQRSDTVWWAWSTIVVRDCLNMVVLLLSARNCLQYGCDAPVQLPINNMGPTALVFCL